MALYPGGVVGSAPIHSFHTDEYRRFVAALAAARRDAGLSQRQLAERLGVDQAFVSRYETAQRRLDVIQFLKIVAAIGGDYRNILDQLAGEAD